MCHFRYTDDSDLYTGGTLLYEETHTLSVGAGVKNVTKYGVSFKNKTIPGDILIAKGEIKKITPGEDSTLVDCKVFIVDEAGDVKVDGKITVKL